MVGCKQAESFVLAGCLLVDARFLEGDDMNLPLFGIQVSIPHGKLEISMLTASVSALVISALSTVFSVDMIVVFSG
jgi:hypothetical protein